MWAWTCGAKLLSDSVGAAVLPRPPDGMAVIALYQAQVRKPSRPARVLSRENGIAQAVVGSCAQAVVLPSRFLGAVSLASWHGS